MTNSKIKKRLVKEDLVKSIYSTWIDGPPYWNEEKGDFEYKGSITVALK